MDSINLLSLAGIQNPEKILQSFNLLITLGLKLVDADEGSLLIFRKEQRDLQFAATVGGTMDQMLIGKTVPLGKGITGMAAMTGEVQTASRAGGGNFFAVQDDGSPNSVIASPIMLDDELIGVITAVSFRENKMFSSLDCQNFSMLSQLGAVIISQEQMIANYTADTMRSLTQQGSMEVEAVQKALAWMRNNPGKPEKILQILSLLSELK